MIIGIGGYWLLTNILFESPNHEFTLTNVQLIGYPIVLMITIVGIIFAFKMSSFKSKLIEFGILLCGIFATSFITSIINVYE